MDDRLYRFIVTTASILIAFTPFGIWKVCELLFADFPHKEAIMASLMVLFLWLMSELRRRYN